VGVEIKGLVAVLDPPIQVGPVFGNIEVWTKWTTEALHLEGLRTATIRKTRRLRKFDLSGPSIREIRLGPNELPVVNPEVLPSEGCNVELTCVRIDLVATRWITLGCEAFGTLHSVESNLRRTVKDFANAAPALARAAAKSYPAFLRDVFP